MLAMAGIEIIFLTVTSALVTNNYDGKDQLNFHLECSPAKIFLLSLPSAVIFSRNSLALLALYKLAGFQISGL
nr:hypothetical protein CFP56_58276 [Quercus suber]